MNKVRVLVIDDNKKLVNSIKTHFQSNPTISIVSTCFDGEKGQLKINNEIEDYDIVLLDIIIPKVDGLSILESLDKKNYQKKIIVMSSLNNEYVISKINQYSFVNYYLIKPFHLKSLENSIMGVNNFNNPVNISHQKEVIKILHNFGIPSHLKGYQYLREILLNYLFDLIGGKIYYIYEQVGKKFNTSPANIERSIRSAIDTSWTRGDYYFIEKVFGHSINFDKTKPSNLELIISIREYLLDLSK